MSYSQIALPMGFGWNFKQTQKFLTTKQKPQSGRGAVAASNQAGVLYDLELVFNYLKAQRISGTGSVVLDYAYLRDFYEAMQGSYGRFIFDPSVYGLANLTVTQDTTQLQNGFCGIGNGTQTVFPMWRSTSVLGGGVVTQLERIQNVSLLSGVYVNGTEQELSAFTQTNFPAQITFNTAPAENAVVSWAGNYNYLCSFSEDSNEINEFMYQLYELKSLTLETINL